MGSHIGIDTYAELRNAARIKLLNGITQGRDTFDSTIKQIVYLGVSFGHDEFARKPKDRTAPNATVDYATDRDSLDKLIEDSTALAIDDLFKGSGLDRVASEPLLAGIAWGRQKAEAEAKAAA